MKRFFCACEQEVFLNNAYCEKCGRDLIYDPTAKTMWSGELTDNNFIAHDTTTNQQTAIQFKPCSNRNSSIFCNWAVAKEHDRQCICCQTTRIIPDQTQPKNSQRWRALERAKRQLFTTLIDLSLPIENYIEKSNGLAFDFLEDQRSNPNVSIEHVLTGHHQGTITLNAAEADEGFLHTMKEEMGENYRTILGHFRHEVGHYYWNILIQDNNQLAAFRELFGDEKQNYNQALESYYQQARPEFRSSQFITPYASSHPHEDWAETWAHYLHIVDTLETAVSYGLSAYEPKINDFDDWFSEWARVKQVMNALNRSMGLPDAYPFILTNIVRKKLQFIDQLIDDYTK